MLKTRCAPQFANPAKLPQDESHQGYGFVRQYRVAGSG